MPRTSGNMLLIVVVVIMSITLVVMASIMFHYMGQKTRCLFPHNNLLIQNEATIGRYKRLMRIWKQFENDKEFCQLSHKLMDTNSNIKDQQQGNIGLEKAYNTLDNYLRMHTDFPYVRVTLIYTDGIVFYDSVLSMDRVYFIDKMNHLPIPVSMYTLGSPLKNHNVLPEVANSLVMNDATATCLSQLHPVYRELFQKGFGFYERMSSSLDKPYCYVSRFLPLPHPFSKNFKDGCTLRIGIEIRNGDDSTTRRLPANIF